MNIVSAGAAGASGLVLSTFGFSGLNLAAAFLILPVLFLAPTVLRNHPSAGTNRPVLPVEPAVVTEDTLIDNPADSDGTAL